MIIPKGRLIVQTEIWRTWHSIGYIGVIFLSTVVLVMHVGVLKIISGIFRIFLSSYSEIELLFT